MTMIVPNTALIPAVSDPLIGLAELAAATGIPRVELLALIASDEIPRPIRIGQTSRWRRSDVEAWIKAL